MDQHPHIRAFLDGHNPSHDVMVAAYLARDQHLGLGKDSLFDVIRKLSQPFAGMLHPHLSGYAENEEHFEFYNHLTREQLEYAGF